MITSNRIQTSVHKHDLSCSYVTHGWPTAAISTLCFVVYLTTHETFQHHKCPLAAVYRLFGHTSYLSCQTWKQSGSIVLRQHASYSKCFLAYQKCGLHVWRLRPFAYGLPPLDINNTPSSNIYATLNYKHVEDSSLHNQKIACSN